MVFGLSGGIDDAVEALARHNDEKMNIYAIIQNKEGKRGQKFTYRKVM